MFEHFAGGTNAGDFSILLEAHTGAICSGELKTTTPELFFSLFLLFLLLFDLKCSVHLL